MPFRDVYRRQAALLVRLLPIIAEEKNFALKGGTAINFFVRDLPRLSVDIDHLRAEAAGRRRAAGDKAAAVRCRRRRAEGICEASRPRRPHSCPTGRAPRKPTNALRPDLLPVRDNFVGGFPDTEFL
jgi:hypothetical protein